MTRKLDIFHTKTIAKNISIRIAFIELLS